jgi:O-antigen ligase
MLVRNYDKLIIYSAVLVTLIFTPGNFDALIIPKVAIAFCASLFVLPELFIQLKSNFQNLKINRSLIIIFCWAIIHLVIIIIFSNAPLEQQIFGRTGRGFGLITYISFLIFLLASIVFFSIKNVNLIVIGLAISTLISGTYAILQKHSLDLFTWDSKTNGIIGTLGNPNFQSSLAAAGVVSLLVLAGKSKLKLVLITLSAGFSLYLVYICQATQGYLGLVAVMLILLGVWYWQKNKLVFFGLLLFSALGAGVAILGMLGKGPLAYYLYKISVQSRGDFFRSAFTTANEFPLTGVGLDSFGDHYLRNRDSIAANHSFAELTDNAHNYFLEFAATGGYPFALLYFLLILLSFICFLKIINQNKSFDKNIAAIFCAWAIFQLQSLISPGSISIMLWNFIICGAIIGAYLKGPNGITQPKPARSNDSLSVVGVLLLILGITLVYPWFNSDRLIRAGLEQGNANILMEQVNSYPRFVNKYRLIGLRLLEANLTPQSLEVAKQAIKFNPEAISGWALILYNPTANQVDRDKAKAEILRLDPWNKEVLLYKY